MLNVWFSSSLKEASTVSGLFASSFELKSAYLASPLSSRQWGKLRSVFSKGIGRKFCSGSWDLMFLPSLVWIIPSQQDAACTHFPINKAAFLLSSVTCPFTMSLLSRQGAHEGWRQVWGRMVGDVINHLSPSSPPPLPTGTPKKFVVVLK